MLILGWVGLEATLKINIKHMVQITIFPYIFFLSIILKGKSQEIIREI